MNTNQQKHFDVLYAQHVRALNLQGKSHNTIQMYSYALKRLANYFDCPPDRIEQHQLKDYFAWLVSCRSWSTVKVDRNGLAFFYKFVLGMEWQWVDIVKPPTVNRLPDVLTQREIVRIINACEKLQYQIFILVTYSMGLRLCETLTLNVGDIDAERQRVHIRDGKGRKDRQVYLPKITLHAMRQFWLTHRHPELLFPAGKSPEHQHTATKHMYKGSCQRAFKAVAKSCNIRKRIHIHTLRHSYATHLMEAGMNLRSIQYQLGHQCPKTTAIYTRLTQSVHQDSRRLISHLMEGLRLNLKVPL